MYEKVLWFFKRTCKIYNWFWKEKNVTINKKNELKSHEDAKECYTCGKGIQKNTKDINYQKVRDHCHYTGKYRGAAHSICNLKFNLCSFP